MARALAQTPLLTSSAQSYYRQVFVPLYPSQTQGPLLMCGKPVNHHRCKRQLPSVNQQLLSFTC